MSFRNTSGYMEENDPLLDLGANNAFTIAYWMRSSDISTDQKTIGQAQLGGGNNRGFSIGPELDVIKAEVFSGSSVVTLKSNPIQADEWIHITMVFDQGQRYELYVDGFLNTTFTTPSNAIWSPPVDDDNPLRLGIAAWDVSAFPYLGDLDDLRIYNTALNAQEIVDIYNNVGLCPESGNPIYVDSSAVGSNNGLTWTDAYTDLQEAIDLSCNCPGSPIWIAEGSYQPTQDNPISSDNTASDVTFYIDHPVEIYGGFAGTETSISERDWRINKTILDGALPSSTDSALHVVVMDADVICPDWILDGLHIRNGHSTESFGFNSSGGGLKINASTQASPIISNCTFYNNKATTNGGAIDANLNDSNTGDVIEMTISNCVFYQNNAGNSGGAIYLNTPTSGNNRPSLINSLFYENATQGVGGAIHATSSGVTGSGFLALEMINCTVADNSATGDGGGIYISADEDAFKIYNSIIWNNTGADGDDLYTSGQLGTIESCVILQIANEQFASVQQDIITQDPLFNTPGSDYSLMPSSPAVNAGDNAAANGIEHDLDGNIRIGCGVIDIGAFEAQNIVCEITCGQVLTNETNANGNSNLVEYPCRSGFSFSGPERIYTFTVAPNDTIVATIELQNRVGNIDVFLLTDPADPSTCIAHTFTSTTQLLTPGTYYIVMDGDKGAIGTYDLSLTCIDYTLEVEMLNCGDHLIGESNQNDAFQNQSALNNYSCGSANFSGPEKIYSIELANTTFVSILLENESTNTDVLVLTDPLNPLSCVVHGTSEIRTLLDAGTYYVIVDGFFGAIGDYDLVFTCTDIADNSVCSEAVALTCGASIGGDLSESDIDPDNNQGCYIANKGLWYQFIGTGDTVEVSLCNSVAPFDDTRLSILTGTCGSLTCHLQDDDGCPTSLLSTIVMPTVRDEVYFAHVSGFNGNNAQHPFTLTFTCQDDEVCLTERVESGMLDQSVYRASEKIISDGSIVSPNLIRFSAPEVELIEGFEVTGGELIVDQDGCP